VRHATARVSAGDAVQYASADELRVRRLVAAAIIERHGGTLRDEEAGAETTTWMRLPVLG
jgi:hypothetical protein